MTPLKNAVLPKQSEIKTSTGYLKNALIIQKNSEISLVDIHMMHLIFTVFAVASAVAFHLVNAAHREDHNNRPAMDYSAERTQSPPHVTRNSSSPQPVKSVRKLILDHSKTESQRKSNAVNGKVAALTIGGHAAIGMARPIARYACQTATCAIPSEKQFTEDEIRTKYRLGKAAVNATLRKTEADINHSKKNQKIHSENYREARKAKGQFSPEFVAEYSPEKNEKEKQQIAFEKTDFYAHSKYLKNLVREPHNYPASPRIEYPNHDI